MSQSNDEILSILRVLCVNRIRLRIRVYFFGFTRFSLQVYIFNATLVANKIVGHKRFIRIHIQMRELTLWLLCWTANTSQRKNESVLAPVLITKRAPPILLNNKNYYCTGFPCPGSFKCETTTLLSCWVAVFFWGCVNVAIWVVPRRWNNN